MFDLSGKTALVTGASGGIGVAIATALHAQGASVVLHGTRAERLAALPAQLARRPTVRLVVMHFVEDEGRAAALVRNLKMRLVYFGIDVDEDVRDLDDQDFRRVTDLAVSYADENALRYGSLSLEGIDGMALAARLRDVASRPA